MSPELHKAIVKLNRIEDERRVTQARLDRESQEIMRELAISHDEMRLDQKPSQFYDALMYAIEDEPVEMSCIRGFAL